MTEKKLVYKKPFYKKPYHLIDGAFADRAFNNGPTTITKAIKGLGITAVCECTIPTFLIPYDITNNHPSRLRVCSSCQLPPGYIAIHYIFQCDDCAEPFLHWNWPEAVDGNFLCDM